MTSAELAALEPLVQPTGGASVITTRRGDYFDLWAQVNPNTDDPSRHAARLSFELNEMRGDSAYLLIGNNDCCVVFVDGAAIWGVAGQREQIESENVVRVPLHAGGAKVDLVTWKSREWTQVPADRFGDEWSVNLSICATETDAWLMVRSGSFHFLDTPVVRSIAGFCSKIQLPAYSDVKLYDLDGKLVGSGAVISSGRIAFKEHAISDDGFVGLMVLADSLAEAVVVTGGRSIDELAEETLENPNDRIPAASGWAFRCRHLMAPKFRNDRDVWWARKAALTMALLRMSAPLARDQVPFSFWRASRLEFGDYLSKLDGTRQYFRYYLNETEPTRARPLAIIFRGVPGYARPFLESYSVADLRTAEEVAALAQETGCDLLWPGDVDADYGGDLTLTWVRECVDVFMREHPVVGYRPTFAVGFCSGGVAATRYAQAGFSDGLVLWTSVVNRPMYRWFTKANQWPLLPASVMDAESTIAQRHSLRRMPILVLFDHNEPGHGDWPGTAALCADLESLGATIEQEWTENPDNRVVWGLRGIVSERRWMQWISDQAGRLPRRSPSRGRPPVAGNTVKSALLRGFTVEPAKNPVAEAWVQKWREVLRSYRGDTPQSWAVSPETTRVEVRAVSGEAYVRELRLGFGRGVPQLPMSETLAEAATAYSELLGIRLDAGSVDRVEVWGDLRSGADGPPAVDLFCEGCCQAALWGRRNGRWELIQAWL